MILIIGATGRIGSETAHVLAAHGQMVRALVRDAGPPRARELAANGVELVVGDLADPPSLDAAMDGADRVLIVSAQHPRQAELQGNAVDAAVRAGVDHIVKVSGVRPSVSPGGPAEVGRQHWHTEHQIEQTGIAFTFLRPNFFMQNLLATAAPMVAGAGVLPSPMGPARVAMVDTRDVAASAAAVLRGGGHRFRYRAYDITGPSSITYPQLARAISLATGQRVHFASTPPSMVRRALLRQGQSNWEVDHALDMASLFRAGAGADLSPAVSELTGQEPRSVEDFIAEHVALFRRRNGSPLLSLAARLSIGLASGAAVVAARAQRRGSP
jgi:uncharacterized protein YbjT (DUF2867 family)